MNVSVRESSMPGIGHRYEIDLSPSHQLFVIVERDGARTIGLMPVGEDASSAVIHLEANHAVTVGALLLGARFSIDAATEQRTNADTVVVDTIAIPRGARSIGKAPGTIFDRTRADAAILAVISDQTPEIVEADAARPLRAGDRIVLAARRERFDDAARKLIG